MLQDVPEGAALSICTVMPGHLCRCTIRAHTEQSAANLKVEDKHRIAGTSQSALYALSHP